jgi:thiol-disulfide isomerase/thioredoxin
MADHTTLTRNELADMVARNDRGIIVVKFGAVWCGPCKKIEPHVNVAMAQMPPNVYCYLVDIDNSVDLYAFLKAKKVVSGVPSILAYYPGSVLIAPEHRVVGADSIAIDQFFGCVYNDALTL